MPSVVALVPVDWFVPAADVMDLPSYRSCDLCHETACEDIWAGKKEPDWRAFWRVSGGEDDGMTVCERCLPDYRPETP